MSVDWRKEFARQHGRKPDAPIVDGIPCEESRERQTAEPPDDVRIRPASKPEASPTEPAETQPSETAAPDPDVDPITGESEEGPAMVQIGPGQFVNERSARALGLVPE